MDVFTEDRKCTFGETRDDKTFTLLYRNYYRVGKSLTQKETNFIVLKIQIVAKFLENSRIKDIATKHFKSNLKILRTMSHPENSSKNETLQR